MDFSFLFEDMHEARDREYKRAMQWQGRQNRAGSAGLVKDVLALANTSGGNIVIGVSQVGSAFSPDGLTPEQLDSFETTRFNEYVRSYADPPVNATVHRHVHEGRRFIIIHVPPFENTPHLCTRSCGEELRQGTLYVRSAGNNSEPINTYADMRSLLDRAARKHRDAIIAAVSDVLKGHRVPHEEEHEARFREQVGEADTRFHLHSGDKGFPGDDAIWFIVEARPVTFKADLLAPRVIEQAFQATDSQWTGPYSRLIYFTNNWPQYQPRRLNDGWEGTLWPGSSFWYWRAFGSGLLCCRRSLEPGRERLVSDAGGTAQVNVLAVVSFIVSAAWYFGRYYENCRLDGHAIRARFEIRNTEGVELYSPPRRGILGQYRCYEPKVSVERTELASVWLAEPDRLAAELTAELFAVFNWRNPPTNVLRDIAQRVLRGQDI